MIVYEAGKLTFVDHGGPAVSRGRKRHLPSDPLQRARRDAETRGDPSRWGIAEENLRLPANEGTVEVHASTRRNVARARRYDVFSLMYYHPKPKLTTPAYDAVRRFQRDLAILHQTQGTMDAIRTAESSNHWLTENFSISRAEAGDRLAAVLDGMPTQWMRQLIRVLCEHEVVRGSQPNWHWIVRQITGELNRVKRGEYVRSACEALAASYSALDNADVPQRRLATA